MKRCTFAEFYRLATRDDGSKHYVEGVGDRSVIILDGRMSLYNQKFLALQEARRRGYDGYRVARGTFTQPFYLTAAVIPVEAIVDVHLNPLPSEVTP